MDVRRHLMAFERDRVTAKGGKTAAEASRLAPGTKAFVVGNPIRLRFPPTQSGKRVMFFDLEDESGLLNVTCFDDVYQRDGHVVICHPYITLWGVAQDRDGHTAFLAQRIFPYQPWLLDHAAVDEPLPFAVADFLMK
jgi:error-prone DNA polymerase